MLATHAATEYLPSKNGGNAWKNATQVYCAGPAGWRYFGRGWAMEVLQSALMLISSRNPIFFQLVNEQSDVLITSLGGLQRVNLACWQQLAHLPPGL